MPVFMFLDHNWLKKETWYLFQKPQHSLQIMTMSKVFFRELSDPYQNCVDLENILHPDLKKLREFQSIPILPILSCRWQKLN